jgi:hypothetical protein
MVNMLFAAEARRSVMPCMDHDGQPITAGVWVVAFVAVVAASTQRQAALGWQATGGMLNNPSYCCLQVHL